MKFLYLRLLSLMLILSIFSYNIAAQEATTSYSAESFFQEEFEKSYRLRKTGTSLFWSGVGVATSGVILSTMGIVLSEAGITDGNTGLLMNITGISLSLGAIIAAVGGATTYWIATERLSNLLENREKFYFPR